MEKRLKGKIWKQIVREHNLPNENEVVKILEEEIVPIWKNDMKEIFNLLSILIVLFAIIGFIFGYNIGS